ncbi:MAG: hypothetical protein ABIX01_06800 [Chitinophagaceae bacterium]
MKNRIILQLSIFPIVFVIAITIVSCHQSSATALPVVLISNPVMVDSTNYSVNAKVTNPTSEDFLLLDYNVACSCTSVDLKPNTKVEKGGALSFKISVHAEKEKFIQGFLKTDREPGLLKFQFIVGK